MRCPVMAHLLTLLLGGACGAPADGAAESGQGAGAGADSGYGYGYDYREPIVDSDGSDGSLLVESCMWHSLGVCYEVVYSGGMEAWCVDIGAAYGIDVSYAANGCDDGTRGRCEGLRGGELGSMVATVHYFDEFSGYPEPACLADGGQFYD